MAAVPENIGLADQATIPGVADDISSGQARVALLAIVVVAAILRLSGLSSHSLWLDEVSSLRNGLVFGAEGLTGLASIDHVAPLHSITLWIMSQIAGTSEVSLRLPSAVAGIITVPVVYLIALRTTESRLVALATALLLTISPLAIWFSQEARMYALFLCFGSLSVLLWLPLLNRPLKPIELTAMTLTTIASYGMHHFMALVVAAFALFLIVRGEWRQREAWIWLACQAIAFLVFAGWLYLTLGKLDNQAGMEKPSPLFWLPYTLYSFTLGFTAGPSLRDLNMLAESVSSVIAMHWLTITLSTASAGTLLLTGLCRVLPGKIGSKLQWSVFWLVGPMLLAIFATMVTNISFNVRYLITSLPAYLIIIATGLASTFVGIGSRRPPMTTPRWLVMAASVVYLAMNCLSVFNYYTSPTYAKEDVRALAKHIEEQGEGALLVTDNDRLEKVLAYYGSSLSDHALNASYVGDTNSVPQVLLRLEAALAAGGAEVWLAQYRSWEVPASSEVVSFLDKAATLDAELTWAGITSRKYHFDPVAESSVQ